MIRASNPDLSDCNEIDLIQTAVLCNQPPGEMKLTGTSRKHHHLGRVDWSAEEEEHAIALCVSSQ